MLRILLVEDSPTDAGLIEAALSGRDGQLEITHVEQMGEAEEYLNEQHSRLYPARSGAAGQPGAGHGGTGQLRRSARADHCLDRTGRRGHSD